MNLRIFFALVLVLCTAACSAPDRSEGADASAVPTTAPSKPTPPQPKAAEAPPAVFAELGLKMVAAEVPADWLQDAVNAARQGKYGALQTHIDPENGLFYIDRPGIAQDIRLLAGAEGLKTTSWESFRTGKTSPIGDRTVFTVQPFKVLPEWMERKGMELPPLRTELTELSYLTDLTASLSEYGFLSLNEPERKLVDARAAKITAEVLVDWVYYYFAPVDGKWKLFGIDIA
ncbi:MAG: hypothetical protein AAFN68_09350, partial [Pseudomonadota bacterium]